jgi:hypothetical protein
MKPVTEIYSTCSELYPLYGIYDLVDKDVAYEAHSVIEYGDIEGVSEVQNSVVAAILDVTEMLLSTTYS